MREFKSTNNLTMVEGELFNWRKESVYYGQKNPFVYAISTGTLSDMYEFVYDEKKHILSLISVSYDSDVLAQFYCETIYDGEKIVQSFVKANDNDFEYSIYYKE